MARDGEPALTAAELHILIALHEEEQHGYAIMQEIVRRTGGRFRIGPGTLYGAIKRLRQERSIEEGHVRADQSPGDERRRYYRLTSSGRRRLATEIRRLDDIVSLARERKILRGVSGGGLA
jgi:DNA-binding PadR family transcriptional regulator